MFHKSIFSLIQAASARFIPVAVCGQRHWLIHITHVFSFDKPTLPMHVSTCPPAPQQSCMHLIEPGLHCCSKPNVSQTPSFISVSVIGLWKVHSHSLKIYVFIRPVAHSTTAGWKLYIAHNSLLYCTYVSIAHVTSACLACTCYCLPSGFAIKSSTLRSARVGGRFLSLLLPLSCCGRCNAAAATLLLLTRLLQRGCCF